MSYAPDYTPTNSFADDETNQVSGRSTVKTEELDAQFADISSAHNDLNANVKKIQRDDDKLRDFIVEPYALSEQTRSMLVAAGKNIRGEWLPFVNYAVGDLVQRNAVAYICQTAHNSGPAFNLGFWIAISGDGSAQSWAEQALASQNAAAASAATASGAAITATAAAVAALVSQTAAAASALAAQNAADSIAGLAPVNLSAYMLDFLANNNAASARSDLAAVGTGDLADATDLTKGAGLSGFSYGVNYVVGTLGGVAATLGIDITQKPYLADKSGASSVSAAIAAVIAAFPGIPIRVPAGTYRVDTEIPFVPVVSGTFGPGLQIYGDGPLVTKFDSRVAGGAVFRLATSVLNTFQHSVRLHGFQIMTTAAAANSTGISLRSCYNADLKNVWVNGLTADAIKVIISNGDQDASNMMNLTHVRLENCGGWGFNTEVTGSHNEFSFLRLRHVFIQGNGTSSATVPPPSGGMRWKGQILNIKDCAFTLNQNVGLYVQGGLGLANQVTIENTAFENNFKRHGYCDGVDGFTMRRCQMYSNDSHVVQRGFEFSGTTYLVRNVNIEGTLVRASAANNAYTAFTVSGANANMDSIRVRGTAWGDFDYAGQARFSGIQFDSVPKECTLTIISTTSISVRPSGLNGRSGNGNKMPIRLRGGAGGVPSTTGEWVATQVANAGITATNGGLAASTLYYVYLYDNNGVPTLELSTTADAVATTPATGYSVKSTDETRLFVGRTATNAASQFLSGGVVGEGAGWLNPNDVSGRSGGSPVWMWESQTQKLYVKFGNVRPANDTDGTIVGTQT